MLTFAAVPADLTSMTAPRSVLGKLVAAFTLIAAFLVMASIFMPDRTPAGTITSVGGPPAAASADSSADPHAGLRCLGSIEGGAYRVEVYATAGEPRYSVFDTQSGALLGALLSAPQVDRFYPEIGLGALELDASATTVADHGF